MSRPLWKYSKWICPVCGEEVDMSTASYNNIKEGIFIDNVKYNETTWECKSCGWSYWTKEAD